MCSEKLKRKERRKKKQQLLFVLSFFSSPSCCGEEVSPRCHAIKALWATAAVGCLQKLSSHSLGFLSDFMPHLSEVLHSARAISTNQSAIFFFFPFFSTDDSLVLSEIEVTQNSLCVSGTPCEVIAWALWHCYYCNCAFIDTAIQSLLKCCTLLLGQEPIR